MHVPVGLRYMVGAAFFFSIMSLLVKIAGRTLPTTEIVFARSILGVLITYTMVRRAGIGLWGNRKSLLIARGLVGFGGLLSYFYAVTHLPLADVTVIFFTNPVFTATFAALFLGERMSVLELFGVALSMVGVAFVAQPPFLFGTGAHSLPPLAVGSALLSAILSGLAFTVVRKLRETEHALTVIFYYPLIAAPLALPLMIKDAVWPQGTTWLVLLGIGAVTQVAHVFLTRGLHAERAGRAMSMSYVQIIFAVVWGMLFFAETPSLWTVFGASLIVAGTLVILKRPAVST